MWPQRGIRVMLLLLLLLSCAMPAFPHQGAGEQGTDQILILDHPRPACLISVNPKCLTDQAYGGKDGAQQSEQEDVELTPRLQSHSLDDGKATTDQYKTSHPDLKPEPYPKTPPWTGPCFRLVEDPDTPQRVLLNAVLKGWGRQREPEKEDVTRFGLCLDPDGNLSGLNSVLSAIANSVEKDRGGLLVLHPTRELWGVAGEHQQRELTLHFPLPPSWHSQVGGLTPVLFFTLGGPIRAEGLSVSFTSLSLLPHRQTVCISAGTRYAVLTGRQKKDHTNGHVVLRITLEQNQAEEGEKRNLQDLLTGEGAGPKDTQGPLLMIKGRILDHSDSPSSRLTEVSPSPAPVAPSRTFLFLCVLQKFLSEALSLKKSVPAQSATVSLDALQSLPPLSLGVSSSESLLLGFLNSSAPTLFSFPHRATELLEHRVELDLKPPLEAMLRLRLEDAATRLAREAKEGRGHWDRLQKLQELSSLPGEGEEAPADMENHREAQYRALLLFKALQMVLGAWEEERSLRSARGGDEVSERAGLCRLQALTVSLKNYVHIPATATINNCEGTCSFPLADTNNHAVLLNSHAQSGQPLERSLCCVPLEYEDLQVVELKGAGTMISIKPDMVAKKCGCR